jgi:hypothetical protein
MGVDKVDGVVNVVKVEVVCGRGWDGKEVVELANAAATTAVLSMYMSCAYGVGGLCLARKRMYLGVWVMSVVVVVVFVFVAVGLGVEYSTPGIGVDVSRLSNAGIECGRAPFLGSIFLEESVGIGS